MTEPDEPTVDTLVAEAAEALSESYGDVDLDRDSPALADIVALAGDEAVGADARSHAIRLVAHVAERHPEALVESLPDLVALMADDDRQVRRHATRTAVLVLKQRPEVSLPLDALGAHLSNENDDTRRQSARALALLGETRASDLRPAVADLQGALDDENREVRRHAIRALGYAAEADPAAVTGVVDDLRAILDDEGASELHEHALWMLASVAEDHPESVLGFVDVSERALERRDRDAQRHAARVLEATAKTDPERVADAIPTLLSHLGTEGLYKPAARALVAVAAAEPERVRDDLADRLESGKPELREHAGWALALLASERPDLVRPLSDRLFAFLSGGDYQRVSTNAARALASVARADPTGDVADRLVERLQDDDPMIRRYACVALGESVQARPTEQLLSPLLARLEDDSELVRSVAVGVLSETALKHPDALESETGAFLALLDHENASVRGYACVALGSIGGREERAELRAFADEEGDPEVREAAEEAIAEIDQRTAGDD